MKNFALLLLLTLTACQTPLDDAPDAVEPIPQAQTTAASSPQFPCWMVYNRCNLGCFDGDPAWIGVCLAICRQQYDECRFGGGGGIF